MENRFRISKFWSIFWYFFGKVKKKNVVWSRSWTRFLGMKVLHSANYSKFSEYRAPDGLDLNPYIKTNLTRKTRQFGGEKGQMRCKKNRSRYVGLQDDKAKSILSLKQKEIFDRVLPPLIIGASFKKNLGPLRITNPSQREIFTTKS